MAPRAVISWSGGKDSCLALLRSGDAYDLVGMLTMFNEDGSRSRSHGLRPEIVAAHAERLGVSSLTGRASWDTYTTEYVRVLGGAIGLGATHVIFGDVMGDAHRQWNASVCAAHGLTPIMPLWGEPTGTLVREFLDRGGAARFVTVRAPLDIGWLGRPLTLDAVTALGTLGADPCGELGEYHTLVTDCPRFSSPLPIACGRQVQHGDCWAIDVTI